METLHITPTTETMTEDRNTPGVWHWIVPVIVSMVITGATLLLTMGGSLQRLSQVETDVREVKQSAATKEQIYELKQDVREVKQDVKELIKQNR